MNPAESASRDVTTFFKDPPKPKKGSGGLRRKALNKGTRPKQEWSSDEDYAIAHALVMERAKGKCEHCRTEPATNVHHKAGRGFAGCHHPMLLVALCGSGNTSGCHQLAHSVSVATGSALGLRLPWRTTADDLEGTT